ncbi:MAG: hypothetical protein GYB67_17400 [Chloroflexi bacterium]|nr:hypothetical protein [Chloroflexota bacterium]
MIIIGFGLGIFGILLLVTASNGIEQNIAYQTQQSGQEIAPSEAEALALLAADVELRELRQQRNFALIFAGAGLILIALGWLSLDAVRRRQNRARPATASNSPPDEAADPAETP